MVKRPIVLGVSGASGITLTLKALRRLTELGEEVHLILTKDALLTAAYEVGSDLGRAEGFLSHLSEKQRELVTLVKLKDFTARIASGSFLTKGMCILPCSMTSLAAVAIGLSDNVLRRAADVTLKERRPLVIVPREAPLNAIHLENMLKLTQMGAVIFPPVPAWYMQHQSLSDMEEFMVNRILESLNIEDLDYKRWGDR